MSVEAAQRTDVADVIAQCARSGVRMSVDGEQLRLQLPQGGITPSLVTLIKENKLGLIRALRAVDVSATKLTPPPIARAAPLTGGALLDAVIPLAYGQENLWLGEEMADVGDMSHLTVVVRIQGRLDVAALRSAVAFILQRHAPLRTRFPEAEDGRPYQQVLPAAETPFEMIDRAGVPTQRIEALLAELHQRRFRLKDGFPCRNTLIRLSADRHIFVLTTHHICSDGWSIGVLLREIGECYQAAAQGRAPTRPAIDIEYSDYARWQKSSEDTAWFSQGLQYWKQRLANPPALHGLPLDRPRPTVQSYGTARVSHDIDLATLRRLEAFALAQGTTLFVALMSGFGILVHRYSGDEDMIVGTPIANRLRDELSPLVGLFMNVLAMRLQIRAVDSGADLIARTHAHYLRDIEHQGIPIERVAVEVARESKTLGHAPLAQLSFVLHNNAVPEVFMPGLECRTEFTLPGASVYDLNVSAHETGQGLHFDWQYNTGLFDENRIRSMAAHFANLLRELMSFPARQVGELQMITDAERAALLALANDTTVAYAPEVAFHELIEARAASHPRKTAVVCGAERLDYQLLNRRANQLAHWLRSTGRAQPDLPIGVCVERSPEMLIALLAVAKAGAAYLPLDPAYPAARLSQMIELAGAGTVIASRATAAAGAGPADTVLLDADDFRAMLDSQPATNPSADTAWQGGSNLAYLIYTSGSTGAPKGVMVEHRSLTNFLRSMQKLPGIQADDVVLAVTTPSFDIHTLELFAPLVSGATVVIAGPSEYADPAELARLIDSHAVSVVQATPTTWMGLMDYGWSPKRGLKALCGGEALPEALKDKLLACRRLALWNMYGPTETCVWSAVKRIEKEVVIGRPIANTRFYVLDHELAPVPIGIEGDLYIAGDGLARGYRDQPELTAAVFRSSLPPWLPEKRIYKTGDRVCRRADGDLAFRGRRDHQVKVNGFRIETGEVTRALETLPGVKQAAVVVRQRANGAAFLAAFVVPDGDAAASTELGSQLQTLLPRYMIPAVFERIERLPLTANGKLDVRQLASRALQSENVTATSSTDMPQSAVERAIAAAWTDLLGLEKLTLDHDLFACGADSIRVLMFIGRMRKQGVKLRVSDVYRTPTVRALAGIAAQVREEGASALYAGPAPLLADQLAALGNDFIWRKFFINFMFDLPRPLDLGVLQRAFARLAATHDALRARFAQVDGQWRQHIVSDCDQPAVFAETLACGWLEPQAPDEARAATDRVHARLSIEHGPVSCAAQITDRDGACKLLFCVSHLVADGFSTVVLIEDLVEIYASLRAGAEVVQRNALSIGQWAPRYREHVNSEAFCAQIDFWESLPWGRCAPLPLDHPQNNTDEINVAQSARHIGVQLDAASTQAVHLGVTRQLGISARDFIAIALARVLMRWNSAHAVALDLHDAGRTHLQEALALDLSQTVGAFSIRNRVLLERVSGLDPRGELLAMNQQLARMPQGGAGLLPLQVACERMDVAERARRIPKAEVWFNYFGVVNDTLTSHERADADIPSRMSEAIRHIQGVTHELRTPRERILSLSALIRNGVLELDLEYSAQLHREETVRALAQQLHDELVNTLRATGAI